jgi:hypothetical protein
MHASQAVSCGSLGAQMPTARAMSVSRRQVPDAGGSGQVEATRDTSEAMASSRNMPGNGIEE